jgi:hypothetical protein
MTYSESILGKKIGDLTLNHIEEFFQTNREESLNLEFKSYPQQGKHDAKEYAVKRAVCALLNSEGGIVIWGAPIEVEKVNGYRSATGSLTPFSIELDKDRLVNKLTSSITPMPVGIKVELLTNKDGNSVVLIEVEKSLGRPHQFENLFFVRLDGQSRIAPHYLIRALMLAKEFPVLKGHVRLLSIEKDRQRILLNFRLLVLNSTQFINEKNFRYRLVADPGNLIIGANSYEKGFYDSKPDILSKGGPHTIKFRIDIQENMLPCSMFIMLHFGGEKSPFKSSDYEYKFHPSSQTGIVNDETKYLIKKQENKLSTEISDATDEEIIESIFKLGSE